MKKVSQKLKNVGSQGREEWDLPHMAQNKDSTEAGCPNQHHAPHLADGGEEDRGESTSIFSIHQDKTETFPFFFFF